MHGDWRTSAHGNSGNVYAEFLKAYEWDYMATFTFRRPRKDPIFASQCVWNLLDSRCFIDRAFLSSEPHTTGFIHFHALLHAFRNQFTGDGFRNAKDIELEATSRLGFSSVSPIQSMEAVSAYCAKYVTKAIDGDSQQNYDFYGQWRISESII